MRAPTPPRILMVAAEYPPQLGGVATYTAALARTMKEGGIDVEVVTAVPGGTAEGQGVSRLSLGLNRKYLKTVPLLVGTFARALRRRPDLLLLMKCNHEGIVGAAARGLLGLPYVVAAYGSEILAFRRHPVFGRFMTWLYRRATRVLVDSAYAGGLVAECGVDPSAITVVHPGLDPVADDRPPDLDDFRRAEGLEGKRLLLTVSRLVRRKGHDMVAEALSLLKDDYPDLTWIITGEGKDRAYVEAQIDRLGLRDRVRLVGRRSAEDIDRFYRISDVFVMPSRQEGIDVEGFGIAFVEAALRRLPSVAGRHGGVPEAVGDGEAGLLVDPHDPRDVARGIRALLDDPALARRLGEQGRTRAIREFGRERQAGRLLALFTELSRRPPRLVPVPAGGGGA